MPFSIRGIHDHDVQAVPWVQIRMLSGRVGTSLAPDSSPLCPEPEPAVTWASISSALASPPGLWAPMSRSPFPKALRCSISVAWAIHPWSGWAGVQEPFARSQSCLQPGWPNPTRGAGASATCLSPCPTSTSPTDLSKEGSGSSRGHRTQPFPWHHHHPRAPPLEEHSSLSGLTW